VYTSTSPREPGTQSFFQKKRGRSLCYRPEEDRQPRGKRDQKKETRMIKYMGESWGEDESCMRERKRDRVKKSAVVC